MKRKPRMSQVFACVLLLLVPCLLNRTCAGLSLKERDCHQAIDATEQNGHSPQFHLPQLVPIVIKYGLVKFWNIQVGIGVSSGNTKYCTPRQTATIRRCGVQKLYSVLGVRHTAPIVDFNKDLRRLCCRYEDFSMCIREFGVQDCEAADKHIVDKIFSYVCGEGYKYLISDGAGMCLTSLHKQQVVNMVRKTTECENSFVDMSSTMESTLSVYHDHDGGNLTEEAPAIKQQLYQLCRNWYTLKTCIFPAYGKLCGSSAERFYVNLIGILKTSLEREFQAFDTGIKHLAKCDDATGRKLKAEPLPQSQTYAFGQYIRRQASSWKTLAMRARLRYGPCDTFTTSLEINSCFWLAVANLGPRVVNITSDIALHATEICNGCLMPFGRCYKTFTEGCKSEDKIDFSDVIESACDISRHSAETMGCLDVLADLNQGQCGSTFSDFANQYILQGAITYSSAQSSCIDNIPFKSLHLFDCVRDTISTIRSTPLMRTGMGSHCANSVLPRVMHFFNSLDTVVKDSASFFKRMYADMCRKKGDL